MIASFHLVEYQRRVLSPPKRLAESISGLRYWRPFNVGGDFASFRDHPGRRHLYPRLRPDFRRWGFFAVWQGEADVDAFMDDPPPRWAEGQRESLAVWLRPIAARGSWTGVEVLQQSERAGPAPGPVGHLVRLDLSLRGTLAMWGSAAPHVLHFIPDGKDLLLGVPLVDRPYSQPMSFSLWSSADAVRRFAYASEGHQAAVARVKRAQRDLANRYSAAEFEPYRSKGAWQGSQPLTATSEAR